MSIYYESEPGRRSAAKLLSKDEARRIAANIAELRASAPSGKMNTHARYGAAAARGNS
jgi:cytochrome c553